MTRSHTTNLPTNRHVTSLHRRLHLKGKRKRFSFGKIDLHLMPADHSKKVRSPSGGKL